MDCLTPVMTSKRASGAARARWLECCVRLPAMSYTADLHLHSRFSYACSKHLTLDNLAAWAKIKGIDLLASADFTHPIWREELKLRLSPGKPGLYTFDGVDFVLGTEVSCVYLQDGHQRRVHLLLLVPDFETADRICLALVRAKCNLNSDGRPTIKLSARDVTCLALEANSDCIVIPAHAWTPWYGMFGSKSGFNSLEECFQDMTPQIHAVETGLSSDPAMIWSIPDLVGRSIVSFSDAHSPPKLGREVTVFEGELSYWGLASALSQEAIAYTVEFYPEEGKYHYTGHRKCGVRQTPDETRDRGTLCPVCRRPLTLGVLHRVAALSTGPAPHEGATGGRGCDGFVRHIRSRPPFIRLIPLVELIAEAMDRGPAAKAVGNQYDGLVRHFGSELQVLMNASAMELEDVAGESIAQSVLRARVGDVTVEPGFDGVYGKIFTKPQTAS